ncbi:MAG: hypothetical protein ABIJ37_00785 [Pseudomonadota bacterium]
MTGDKDADASDLHARLERFIVLLPPPGSKQYCSDLIRNMPFTFSLLIILNWIILANLYVCIRERVDDDDKRQ